MKNVVLIITLVSSCWINLSHATVYRQPLFAAPTEAFVLDSSEDYRDQQEDYTQRRRQPAARTRSRIAFPSNNREYYLDNPYNTQ